MMMYVDSDHGVGLIELMILLISTRPHNGIDVEERENVPPSFIDVLAICLTAIGFIPTPAAVVVVVVETEATSTSPSRPTCSVETFAVDVNSPTTAGNSSLITVIILKVAAIEYWYIVSLLILSVVMRQNCGWQASIMKEGMI